MLWRSAVLAFVMAVSCGVFAYPTDPKDVVHIYVYGGEGVGKDSLQQTVDVFTRLSPNYNEVHVIDAEGVKAGEWTKDAKVFIMPGGHGAPYAEKLNGKGNQVIRQYVAAGGSYLGICAGAYYAAKSIEFDKGGPIEYVGLMELQLFDGVAVGPLTRYYPDSNKGARIFTIYTTVHIDDEGAVEVPWHTGTLWSYKVAYNGGGYFLGADNIAGVSVIGWYAPDGLNVTEPLPAIVSFSYGKGKVVLSGVHFEYNPETMDASDGDLTDIIAALNEEDWGTKGVFFAGALYDLLVP
jgi:biotin--protein ligase